MLGFLADWYLVTKSLHIISMVAWMAGLFYLPRIFVYHVENGANEASLSDVFKTMERKLYKYIMNPSMMSTWLFGIILLMTPGIVDYSSGWIYVKIISLLLLTGFHVWLGRVCQDFAGEANLRSGRFYRLMNEVPTVLLVVIVVMVVVKPF